MDVRGQAMDPALWELLEQGCSREESVSALAERFDVAREMLERDVDVVVDDLLAEELLVVAERPAPAAVPYVSMQAEYATPSLQKFTDMADLLALDPPMPGLDESAWGDATVAG